MFAPTYTKSLKIVFKNVEGSGAVRPRVAVRGQTPRRRQTQGNADLARERAPKGSEVRGYLQDIF